MSIKSSIAAVVLATTLISGAAFAGLFSENSAPTTNIQKTSYSIGYTMGVDYSKLGVVVDSDMLQQGLKAGLENKNPALSQVEMQQMLIALQKTIAANQVQKASDLAAANLKASMAYMNTVAKQSGVQMLQDGLYYKVIKQGTGSMPKATDWVTVNYKGTLPNGQVFYDTFKTGIPETFSLPMVMLGWNKAIQKMPVGSTWMVYVAPNLAYGLYAPVSIGPNQALTFEIQLIAAKPAIAAPVVAAPVVSAKPAVATK